MSENEKITILLTQTPDRLLQTIEGHRALVRHGVSVRASHEAMTVLYDTGSATLQLATDTDLESLSAALLDTGVDATPQPGVNERTSPGPSKTALR